jgi:mannitol-specific phosphotransferase system IIBC component
MAQRAVVGAEVLSLLQSMIMKPVEKLEIKKFEELID